MASFYERRVSDRFMQQFCMVLEVNWSLMEVKQILQECVKIRHVFPTIASVFEVAKELGFKTRSQKQEVGAVENTTSCTICGNDGMVWVEGFGRKSVVACHCARGLYLRSRPGTGCPMALNDALKKGFTKIPAKS